MANTAGVKLTVRGHLTIPSYGQAAVRRLRRSEMDNPWAPMVSSGGGPGRALFAEEFPQANADEKPYACELWKF